MLTPKQVSVCVFFSLQFNGELPGSGSINRERKRLPAARSAVTTTTVACPACAYDIGIHLLEHALYNNNDNKERMIILFVANLRLDARSQASMTVVTG